MPLHDFTHDRQSQTQAAGLGVGVVGQADERLEDALAFVFGNSGAVVVDDDLKIFRRPSQRDCNRVFGVALGVVQQI